MDPQGVAHSGYPSKKLPAFEPSGYLPVGIHPSSLDELASRVCFNGHRRKMWQQLACFLAWPVLTQRFRNAYIGGGFVSSKEEPRDTDVVLETVSPYGPEAFTTVASFFVVGLEKIERLYGVHLQFWMQGAPAGLSDYRVFFQYDRTDEFTHLLNRSRGVACVNLIEPDSQQVLARHLRGEGGSTASPAASSTRQLEEVAVNLPGMKSHLARLGLDSTQMIILTDAAGRIEWVNASFVRSCGYNLDEVRGKKPGEILQGPDSDDTAVQMMRRAIKSGQRCDCQIVNYRKDGSLYLNHITLEPIFGPSGLEGFISVCQDLGPANEAPRDQSENEAAA